MWGDAKDSSCIVLPFGNLEIWRFTAGCAFGFGAIGRPSFKVGEDKHSPNLEPTSDRRGDCNLESDTDSNSHRPVLVECFSPSLS